MANECVGFQVSVYHCLAWLCILGSVLVPVDGSPNNNVNSPLQPVGHRFPKHNYYSAISDCHAGSLCVGPGELYPLGHQVGVLFSSTFTVPALPQAHDPVATTYYDYFNIFWRSNPLGGYMNQFVPQLMLGNSLAKSSNYPEYQPQWVEMETWHIGAQYFMGLCDTNTTSSCPDSWIAKAATGELIPVEPGEVIETTFQLLSVRGRWEWHLRIGVVGQPHRTSVVVADRPFMGLVESTTSWDEETYEFVYVGSCLENYGMQSSKNYSPSWQIEMITWSLESVSFWKDWRDDETRTCDWQPKSAVVSNYTAQKQWAIWKAKLEPDFGSKSLRTRNR